MVMSVTHTPAAERTDHPATLHIGPSLDLVDLRWQLHTMVAAGHREIVVDLREAKRLDFGVLAAFLIAHRACRGRGGAVVLADPSPQVRQQIQDGGFAMVLPVVNQLAATGHGRAASLLGDSSDEPSVAERVLCRAEHDVNGWEFAAARGAEVSVRVRRGHDALALSLVDQTAGASIGVPEEQPRRSVERTTLVLDSDGRCRARRHCSPSLIHIPADGGEATTVSDVEGAALVLQQDAVVLAPTTGLLDSLPPTELTRLRRRVLRRHRIEAIARDLVGASGGEGSSSHSAVVVVRRASSRGTGDAHTSVPLIERSSGERGSARHHGLTDRGLLQAPVSGRLGR